MSVSADSVRELRKQGYSYKRIGEMLGCSETWAYALDNPEQRAKLEAASRARIKSGVCTVCGGPMTHPKFGVYKGGKPGRYCQRCWTEKVRRERIPQVDGDGNLWCSTCKAFHAPDEFPPSMRDPARLTRRCSQSDSARRRRYIERRKVPCENCGKPRLPGDGKVGSPRDSGLCSGCYIESMRAAS